MTAPRRPALRDERGAVLPLVALMIVVLLGFGAIAIDVGNAYLHKRRLQSAADFAALAAAQRLPDVATAVKDAGTFANANWSAHDASKLNTTVTTGCMASEKTCAQPDSITVTANADVDTGLAKLFGLDHYTVHAKATACGPCDSSAEKYDVMVVLDRSYSMCLDSNGRYNSCYDMNQAIAGIKSLLQFFDPKTDRVGLAALSSGDSTAPFSHTGAAFPCDTSDHSFSGAHGPFYQTLGDFMDGTPASHDSWVLAPLAADFKNADGTVNSSSQLGTVLNCIQTKGWTPLAPAVQAATQELVTNGRNDPQVKKVLVVLSDGGANVQPMKVDETAGKALFTDASGNDTTDATDKNGVKNKTTTKTDQAAGYPLYLDPSGDQTTTEINKDGTRNQAIPSWYTPSSPANNLQPCHDSVGQAAIAKAQGIEVFTIGYDLNASSANACYTDNHPNDNSYREAGIDATSELQQMASTSSSFYQKADPGELYSIFDAIGHTITSGGVRLTQ